MESKVATYSEKNVRLQLVRVQEGSVVTFELRLNRRIIQTFTREQALFARLVFSHRVSMILVDRLPVQSVINDIGVSQVRASFT